MSKVPTTDVDTEVTCHDNPGRMAGVLFSGAQAPRRPMPERNAARSRTIRSGSHPMLRVIPTAAVSSTRLPRRSTPLKTRTAGAVVTMLLGLAAVLVPYFFGALAVMTLGGVMAASGVVSLFYVNAARGQGIQASVFGPWVQIIAGIVILVWPELALWLVAVILGGGLVLNGITGLTALRDSGLVNPPVLRRIGLWSSILLGLLLIVTGAAGSAVLLGVILGIALLNAGLQQWQLAG